VLEQENMASCKHEGVLADHPHLIKNNHISELNIVFFPKTLRYCVYESSLI